MITTNTDRELLELAAKGAGYGFVWHEWVSSRVENFGMVKHRKKSGLLVDGIHWNPLTDDGDALRLAVKLRISLDLDYVSFSGYPAVCANLPSNRRYWWPKNSKLRVVHEFLMDDDAKSSIAEKDELVRGIEAATRRAIVLAAAEIGRAMSRAK